MWMSTENATWVITITSQYCADRFVMRNSCQGSHMLNQFKNGQEQLLLAVCEYSSKIFNNFRVGGGLSRSSAPAKILFFSLFDQRAFQQEVQNLWEPCTGCYMRKKRCCIDTVHCLFDNDNYLHFKRFQPKSASSLWGRLGYWIELVVFPPLEILRRSEERFGPRWEGVKDNVQTHGL